MTLIWEVTDKFRSHYTPSKGHPLVDGGIESVPDKKIQEELERRLEDDVSTIDYYSDVTGSSAFDQCYLGMDFGIRHYGDAHVEKWVAYAGEKVDPSRDRSGCEKTRAPATLVLLQ